MARLVDEGRLPRGRKQGAYKRVHLHRIALSEALDGLTAGSKVVTDYDFLVSLQEAGKKAARKFLRTKFDRIGEASTVDLEAEIAAEWVS